MFFGALTVHESCTRYFTCIIAHASHFFLPMEELDLKKMKLLAAPTQSFFKHFLMFFIYF